MTISIISAIAKNNVIGKDNDLIWHISEDLKRFKKLTSGCSIIMGRKTYESLPFKPLPNRKNIVISSKKIEFKGSIVVSSPEEALKLCKEDEEVFICGGASIYSYFLDEVDKMYITEVHESFEGDTFFPEIDYTKWKLTESQEGLKDKKNNLKYSFRNYIRKHSCLKKAR